MGKTASKLPTLSGNFEDFVRPGEVFMFSKSYCPYCNRAKDIFRELEVNYRAVECDKETLPDTVIEEAQRKSGIRTFPNIWIGTRSVGGCDNLKAARKNGTLFQWLDEEKISHKQQ